MPQPSTSPSRTQRAPSSATSRRRRRPVCGGHKRGRAWGGGRASGKARSPRRFRLVACPTAKSLGVPRVSWLASGLLGAGWCGGPSPSSQKRSTM
eukprot:7126726-Prymnesium_polylepis.2